MKKFVCLLLACLMLMSCVALAEEVPADVIAVVNGEYVMAEEAMDEYQYYLEYYAAYGITDEESLGQLRRDLTEQYARDLAVEQKIAQMEIEMPTVEEAQVKAENEYESTTFELLSTYAYEFYTGEGDLDAAVAAFIDYRSQNPDATVAETIEALGEADKAVMQETMAALEAYYLEMNYTMESVTEYWLNNLQTLALFEYVMQDLEITEDDVIAYYDEMVAAEEAAYAEDPGYLERLIASGSMENDPIYVPEGYRYVEHILILMDSTDQNNMYTYMVNLEGYEASIAEMEGVTPMDAETYNALKERRSQVETRQKEIQGLLLNEDADIDGLTAEQEELNTEWADLTAQLGSDEAKLYTFIKGRDDAEAQIAAVKAKYQDKLDAVYARLENGEDFTALVLECGEDPGMLNETKDAVVPYLVYENTENVWEENFAEAAVALAEGEYTQEPVWTTYGAHIIMNKGAVPAGAVAYEEVREKMTEEYTQLRQEEVYSATLENWYAESEVELYPDNLKTAE